MNGKWITCDASVETPLFEKQFTVRNGEQVKISICGLGYFTLLCNGKPVTDDLFVPAQTNYTTRDLTVFGYPIYDTISTRTLYVSYDLTAFVHAGENTLSVILGNGWYRQNERLGETHGWYGDSLLCCFDLYLTDPNGTTRIICSDGTENGYVYPILHCGIFSGELWDTRMFAKPLPKTEVKVCEYHTDRLELQTCPRDRVIRTICPKEIAPSVYDAGENITGRVVLKVKGESGAKITLQYAEEQENGVLDFISTGGGWRGLTGDRYQIQEDAFLLDGSAQTLTTMFVFHCFRYFSVAGEATIENVRVEVIHTDIERTSTFTSDNAALNWLYDAYCRTQLDNLHGCVPSDCPHRERLGYTGDGQICAPAVMLCFDAKEVYRKWIADILDCQDQKGGHVQHTAPFMGGGGGPGGWGGAIVLVPWDFYCRYGDKEMLADTYFAMQRYLEYLFAHSDNHLVMREEKGGWCLGDWATPGGKHLPEPFVNTCYLIVCLEIVAKVTQILGYGDGAAYLAVADASRKAVEQTYYDGTQYIGGDFGADAFAAFAKLPHAEEALARTAEKYRKLGYMDTGFLATAILPEMLFTHGYAADAVALMASEDTTTLFGAMRKAGATTIWEYSRNPKVSQCHPMYGACTAQLFTGLLGIRQRENTAGYTDLVISPTLDSLVKHAAGSIYTAHGRVSVEFTVSETGSTELIVEIPEGVQAELRVKDMTLPLICGKQFLLV